MVGAAGLVAIAVIVGGPTDALTVSTKLEVVVKMPSVALSVIVDVPVCPVAGVTVTVRLAPLPPITTFAVGTSVVLEELALTARIVGDNSASPTVNASALVAVPCAVLWLAMVPMVGAVL